MCITSLLIAIQIPVSYMYEWVDRGNGSHVNDYKTLLYCHRHDTRTGEKNTEVTPRAPANIFLPGKIKGIIKKNPSSFTECDNQRQILRAVGKKPCSLYVPVIRNW